MPGFDFLYESRDGERWAFGSNWCGPDVMKHAEDVLIAKYPKEKDGDGQSVEVFCCAMPARFYTLVVASEPNSIGVMQDGFTVRTGSSQHEIAAKLAEAIASGMIGFYAAKKEETE